MYTILITLQIYKLRKLKEIPLRTPQKHHNVPAFAFFENKAS